jgi:hypothetical protein
MARLYSWLISGINRTTPNISIRKTVRRKSIRLLAV